jgi:hypothetical protein
MSAASLAASLVFPDAVGPRMTMRLQFFSVPMDVHHGIAAFIE